MYFIVKFVILRLLFKLKYGCDFKFLLISEGFFEWRFFCLYFFLVYKLIKFDLVSFLVLIIFLVIKFNSIIL